jgi:polyferredoxin
VGGVGVGVGVGVGIGLARGRKWCNWFCPRGSFSDTLVKSISPKKEIPELLKKLPLRIAVLIFLMSVMTANLVLRWPDPGKIGQFFVLLLTITTVLGVVLALFFHQRCWCYICPIGTLINLTGGGKYPLKLDSKICIDCKNCFKVCPVQISPYKNKKQDTEMVKEADCLKCNLCISICPKNALSR